MAGIAVNGVIQTVSQLLNESPELIEGAEKEIRDLLESLNYLLEEFSGASNNNQPKQDLDEDTRSTLGKIELVIDKFLSDAKTQQEKNVTEICFCYDSKTKVRKLAGDLVGLTEEVDQTPGINQQVESAKSAMVDYVRPKKRVAKKGIVEPGVCPKPNEGTAEPEDPTLDDKGVVGNINEDAEKLIKRLTEGPEDLDIVPIVGMVGLGKTTLAQKIYYDTRISCKFPVKIWIDVGQSSDITEISLKILGRLKKPIEKHQHKDVEESAKPIEEYQHKDMKELAKELRYNVADADRCLVVLDNVWEESVVEFVEESFTEYRKGHRMMITTRLEYVATKANEHPHYLELLTVNESFKLLKMNVFGMRSFPDELQGLGESIARKCSGLPLSVVVIAKILRRMDRSNWKQVEKNVRNCLLNKDDPESRSCCEVVKSSYDHLPHEMKLCFLYCGTFPQGFDIPAWKLTRLWIAERLIWPKSSTLEKIAEDYLKSLVDRNLLMVKQKGCDGQIKVCHVHDLMHEFCKAEATSKMILQEICQTPQQDIHPKGPYTSQGLCIQPSDVHGFLSTKPIADQVRSFYCFSSKQTETELSSDDLQHFRKAFPLIRVLDIECLKIIFNKDFHQLIHLRYLAISGDFTDLPLFFDNFTNLQTLIVNTSATESTLDIKANIWSMSNLRHLHTNIPVRLPLPPIPTDKASGLLTLSIVAPESCKKDVISKASKLRKLSIRGKLVEFLETKGGGWRNFEELKSLEQLKLLNDASSTDKKLQFSQSCITFLCALKKLILSGTKFDWSEANILGKLKFLEVLKLEENAFTGMSWKPEIGGFTELQVLWIKTMDLETWEASELHFPRLRQLFLISCDMLKAVPYELAGIRSLQEIRLENTSKAVKSAKEIAAHKKLESIKFKLIVSPPQTD